MTPGASDPMNRSSRARAFLESRLLHAAVVIALGALAYSNTFHSPFQWDEHSFIRGNPIVRDLGYFLDPSSASGLPLYDAFTRRYVGYLTFAINYRLNGLDVSGYHAVNLAVHLANGLLVYLFCLLVFRTPFVSGSRLARSPGLVGFLAAAIFVSHPVQTEAVTYIFQRFASLAATFCLISLNSYTAYRLSEGRGRKALFYALAVFSAAVSMKTKENSFTLPFAIALYEFMFFAGPRPRRVLALVPLVMTALIVPYSLLGGDLTGGGIFGRLEGASEGYAAISRKEYFLTQIAVVATYMRLLVLPVNQNFDYDFPLYASFLAPRVIVSVVVFLAVSGGAGYLVYRSRTNPALRVVSFGVFWFFLMLSVESSLVPIPMVINEYRLYLPSAGAFLAMAVAASMAIVRIGKRAAIASAVACALVPAVLSYAAYERNSVWKTEEGLWEDVVKKSPGKANAHFNLGLIYLRQGRYDMAGEEFEEALRIKPEDQEARMFLDFAERMRQGR